MAVGFIGQPARDPLAQGTNLGASAGEPHSQGTHISDSQGLRMLFSFGSFGLDLAVV